MSQIDNLLNNYTNFVKLPWLKNLSGRQRVWFAVYPPSEERRLRAHIKEFECATNNANHIWHFKDITYLPAKWLASHEYCDAYFSEPSAIEMIEEDLKYFVVKEIKNVCQAKEVDDQGVVAITGVGSLFGFTHVSTIISEIEDSIKGRLLVFFPGKYERNIYRFMDAREGFNYMAVPITCIERSIL